MATSHLDEHASASQVLVCLDTLAAHVNREIDGARKFDRALASIAEENALRLCDLNDALEQVEEMKDAVYRLKVESEARQPIRIGAIDITRESAPCTLLVQSR